MKRVLDWKRPDPERLAAAPKFHPHPHLARVQPSSIDLRSQQAQVYDQGSEGACTAHMTAGAIQNRQIVQGLTLVMPSRQFNYYNARMDEGSVAQDAGASILDAYNVLKEYGWCPEEMWQYLASNLTLKPTPDCYQAALPNKIEAFENVAQDLGTIKAALAESVPVGIGFTCFNSLMSAKTAKSGIVQMPSQRDLVQGSIGGHAILLVGYDDSRSLFTFRNSWGETWGDTGYGYMPYDYVADNRLADDFHALRKIPGSVAPPGPTPTPPGARMVVNLAADGRTLVVSLAAA